MEDFRLTESQLATLKALHRTQRKRQLADRVKAIVLLGSGWSVAHIAQALLVDEKTIRLWHEKYQRGGENDPFYFVDACHPQFNSIPAYGWIRRGVDKELKANHGRQRVNINGAVDIDTMEIVTDFADSINSQSTIRLFQKLKARHPKAETIHVITDNAKYYKSQLAQESLKQKLSKIVIHFLPGYSPNLNLIERLWKFFKKKILYNKYYETFAEFSSACKGFFRCRTKYCAELRTLLTEKFQQYQAN